MPNALLAGKRVVVLGLGLHGGGASAAAWLAKHGAQVTVTDLKSKKDLSPSIKRLKKWPIKYVLGRHPLFLLDNCDLVVQNPGVPSTHPILKEANKRGLKIENEASLFLKFCPTDNIVAVTGTRGKSTTVSLLAAMMKRTFPKAMAAGNIRDTLLLDILDNLTTKSAVAVELSSWQLEVVGLHKLRLPGAVITNILPDHLNKYANFRAYIKAKSMIFSGQKSKDFLVLSQDNAVTRKLAAAAKSRVFWFSLHRPVVQGCFVHQDFVCWRYHGQTKKLYHTRDLKIAGQHNLANTLAATTAALLIGVNKNWIKQAVKTFAGLHDRLELVQQLSGVDYYNDTTATSPHATEAALASFANKSIVLIAGGTDKNLSYRHLAYVIQKRVSALVLLPGTATVKLQKELKGFKAQFLASDMPEAVKFASQLVPSGGVVLLSPGAASFGLFLHEYDRGESFKQAVKKLRYK